MFFLEDDFILSLIVSKIEYFSENSVSSNELMNFVENLPLPVFEKLPEDSVNTLKYYFHGYSDIYQILNFDFYSCYKFLDENPYEIVKEFEECKNG